MKGEKGCIGNKWVNRAYIITNKDYLTKENARIKQVLKENGYQESFISKIFKRITNNYSLSRSQQQMQAKDTQEEEIKIMSINLPLIENATENLRPILRSHKTSSTFFTENTGVNYSVNQIVAIEHKNNVLCQIECNKCRAVYFGESKRPLKSRPNELKRIVIVTRVNYKSLLGSRS